MAKKDLKLGESSISVKRGRGSGTGETVNLKREAFNRKQFDDTINTKFTELG